MSSARSGKKVMVISNLKWVQCLMSYKVVRTLGKGSFGIVLD
jgi:hypothetical protein